jgi:hypothetical protein
MAFHDLGNGFAKVRGEGLYQARHRTFEACLETGVDHDRTLA